MTEPTKPRRNEEEYFFKANQVLVLKRREHLDNVRTEAKEAHAARPYWMICPKCGVTLQEIEISGVKVDQCGGCNGVYLDNGELETLIKSKEVDGFLRSVSRAFGMD